MKKGWDAFWKEAEEKKSLFSKFTAFYRIRIIAPAVNYYINRYFDEGGIFVECGSGASETTLKTEKGKRKFIALDYSELVLKRTAGNPKIDDCINADIFSLPFKDNSIDGVWNVGVMEHFYPNKINEILKELRRVLKKDGRLVLFWPMAYAPYEIFINIVEFIANKIFGKQLQFYPDEVSRLKSRKQARDFLKDNMFNDVKFYFNFRDAFSFGVLIGKK
jgi:ubiquinone/menaquinone biosynthesis C-methylase UbiE